MYFVTLFESLECLVLCEKKKTHQKPTTKNKHTNQKTTTQKMKRWEEI
jgi:hypothetical protein